MLQSSLDLITRHAKSIMNYLYVIYKVATSYFKKKKTARVKFVITLAPINIKYIK